MSACKFTEIEMATRCAATSLGSRRQPTVLQQQAGNYKMGRVMLHGLAIRIENVRNSIRSGVGADGKAWSSRMAANYGYFAGTKGADGDGVDVFVGAFPESTSAWVINQCDAQGAFDEHKVMLGFHTEDQARTAYLGSYSPGWGGLKSVTPVSVSQLKWWLKNGDKAGPLTADQLPSEGKPIMDKVLWNRDAAPVTNTLPRILYALRAHDAQDGLMFDALTMPELLADPDLVPQPMFDALNVEVGMLKRKMDQVLTVMKAAAETVTPTDFIISDPVKSKGVLQIAVIFSMSDGQTITVWFHNPDSTPAKLTPMDILVSWKWMLNKKDVTIVVAPERGRDLNVREVARRIMRLIERNSEGFQKANAKATDRAAQTNAITSEIAALEVRSTELDAQIAEAKAQIEARANAAPAWAGMSDEELTTADGYAKVRAGGEVAFLEYQDVYDHIYQSRLIAVRNALRDAGWEGERFGTLSKSGCALEMHLVHVGGGRNIVGAAFEVKNGADSLGQVEDDFSASPQEMADRIDALSMVAAPVPAEAPEPVGSEPAPFTYAGRLIYPSRIKVGVEVMVRWCIQTDENAKRIAAGERALGGDRIADTPDEAKAIAEEMNRIAAQEVKDAADVAAHAEAEAAKAKAEADARLEGLDGFVDGMNPMQKARALDALNKFINRRGKTQPVKALIRQLVAEGWTVQDDRTYGRIIANPDGSFIEQSRITKTGLDFGAYLLAKNGIEEPTVPAVDNRTPMERWAAELADIIKAQGFGPYNQARSKIAGDNGLNANQELDLGRLVEGIVGPEFMTLERAKFDPHTAGMKAVYRGDAPIPPEGLSEAQKAEWMKGFDEGADAIEAKKPDPAKPDTGIVFADFDRAVAEIGFTPSGSMTWSRPINGAPGLYVIKDSVGSVTLTARGQKLWEGQNDELTNAQVVEAVKAAVEKYEAGDDAPDDAGAENYTPFDMDQIKMPTAVQLGINILNKAKVWEGEDGQVAVGWTNGYILDVAGRPAVVAKGITKYLNDTATMPRVAADRVERLVSTTKSNTDEATPIAFDNTEVVTYSTQGEKRTPTNGVILANADQSDMAIVNRYALGYFVKSYKGCSFYIGDAPAGLVLVKHHGNVVGVIAPITPADKQRVLGLAKRAITRAEIEGTNPIKQVDDAYKFDQASDRFKEYVADTVGEADYSMFATAKAMDQAAKAQGATIAWDVEEVADVYDAAEMVGQPADGSLFDDATNGAEVSTYLSIVGRISKDGRVVGRAMIAGDGKAMVYAGEAGTERVKFASRVDGTILEARWSDDDAPLMLEWLLFPPMNPDQINASETILREILAGSSDDSPLALTLATIESCIEDLEAQGLLVGDIDQLAQDAITHWATLDEKVNG